MYDDNRYFPDNKLGEQNLSVLEKAVPTSAKSWAGYVTDELTEEGVKQPKMAVRLRAGIWMRIIKKQRQELQREAPARSPFMQNGYLTISIMTVTQEKTR